MNTKQKVLAAGLTLLVVATAWAQRFGENVQVTIVEVPVTVVDRSGNAVRDLTRDDFELFDEGKKVPIEYFEVVDMTKISATGSTETGAPIPPAANRHFLLLFDLANSSPGMIGRASEAAKNFVETELGERDLAAVAVFTAESGAKMITAFTQNRTLLSNAIETLGHPKYFRIADPLMISAVSSAPGTDTTASQNPVGGGRQASDEAARESALEHNQMAQRGQDTELRNRLKIQMQNFGMIARTLDRIRGQKQIVLLSEGFDARLVQGREEISMEKTQQETEDVFAGNISRVDQEQRFGSSAASKDISDMAQLFRRSDVTLHAIDIKGLRGNVDVASGAKKSSNESLFLLTNPTGGTVFKNANDIKANFARMMKQQEVVYVLGFTARGTGKPGKFHELKVKAKAGRANHRAGYYEPGRMSDLERTLSLAEILVTDAPIKDVDVTLAATPLPGPQGKSRVPVLVEMPGPRLLEGVPGTTATTQLYLYAFDEKNQVVDFMQQRINLDLTKAGDTVRSSGVRYFGTLRLAPGNYAIKALVRVDESGRIGFVRSNITVPKFDTAVVLPPVLFAEPSNWVMLVGPTRGDDYAYPFAAGEARYIPKREASMSKDTEYKFALFLNRVPLENLEVKPEISGSAVAPNVKLLGRTSADDRGTIKLLFGFKPDNLPSGEHELRFTVKSKDGNQSVVTIPIRVL